MMFFEELLVLQYSQEIYHYFYLFQKNDTRNIYSAHVKRLENKLSDMAATVEGNTSG